MRSMTILKGWGAWQCLNDEKYDNLLNGEQYGICKWWTLLQFVNGVQYVLCKEWKVWQFLKYENYDSLERIRIMKICNWWTIYI